MIGWRIACVLAMLCVLLPVRAEAQDPDMLFAAFRPERLSYEDTRFLQAALAFEGHYTGLVDGDWGQRSGAALTDFSRLAFDEPTVPWHLAVLATLLLERMEEDGWDMQMIPAQGVSLLWPANRMVRDRPSALFENYRHATSTLAVSYGHHDLDTTRGLHAFTAGQHDFADPPYSLRRDALAISTAIRSDGTRLYTRSDLVQGRWSTVMLSASLADGTMLDVMASSLSPGPPRPLRITEGGYLDAVMRATLALLTEPDLPDPQTPRVNNAGSGSGFIVSESGHVLTNAHVVAGCTTLTVDGRPARRVATSDDFDLALLQTAPDATRTVAVFSARAARLNSDVTVVGYPYRGILGGLNVTRGAVSALTGVGGDATTMQITAPVQSGNSGGPVLAEDGEVVGVVVAKLDARKIEDALGDVPQNINFAIRGEIARLFLAQNGVDPRLSLADEGLAPEAIAERARGFVALIECP